MIMVVDVSGILHAAWAVARHEAAEVAEKHIKNAVFKFTPKRCHLAFDSLESHRKSIYPAYKADRPEKDPALVDQTQSLWKRFDKILPRYCVKGWEADDILATICRATDHPKGEKVLLYSADSDVFQLLEEGRVSVLRKLKSGEPTFMTAKMLEEEHELRPDQWVDYLLLKGKPGQWPGAKGVGEKTARSLLKRTTVQKIIDNPQMVPERLARKAQIEAICAMESRIELGRQILTLKNDLEL